MNNLLEARHAGGVIDRTHGNDLWLPVAHCVLGLAFAFVFWPRHGAPIIHPHHMAGRIYALTVLLQTFAAIAPFLFSGFYACGVLPERGFKASFAFICIAAGVGFAAVCLNRHWFGIHESPPALLILAGVAVALLAATRLCASIWRIEVFDWQRRG